MVFNGWLITAALSHSETELYLQSKGVEESWLEAACSAVLNGLVGCVNKHDNRHIRMQISQKWIFILVSFEDDKTTVIFAERWSTELHQCWKLAITMQLFHLSRRNIQTTALRGNGVDRKIKWESFPLWSGTCNSAYPSSLHMAAQTTLKAVSFPAQFSWNPYWKSLTKKAVLCRSHL